MSEIPDNELDQEVQGEEDEPEGEELATETQGLFPEVLLAKQMACEILIMRRPHADVSYCQWWFGLFR